MTPNELIDQWRFRAHRVQLAHYESARKLDRLHLFLGFPAITLSTIVGTTVFASLSKGTDFTLQVIVGLLSVAAAVLTGLQTFLRYSELSEKHRVAGAKFANLKHRIELLATFTPTSCDELKSELLQLENIWAKLREESPNLSTRVWEQIDKSLTYDGE